MSAENMPLTLHPFAQAILHIDADSFFASVEQALNPAFKGKPVVTGKERGIIAAASYEAKALGISRGLSLHEARRLCPALVVLPSDYETYSLYSKRLFNIVRRFTPVVEESSVDEAFADLTGMRRVFRTSYENIAMMLKEDVKRDMDVTVSIGLSVSKTLAKLVSKMNKPDGLTVLPGTAIHEVLGKAPVGDVWGIGPNGASLLAKFGVRTALDFVRRPEKWVSGLMGKPGREIWNELRGTAVHRVSADEPAPQASISKGKTFSAPSADRDFIYARLARNIESAFIKLRRHRLRVKTIGILLRFSNYDEEGLEAKLNRPTSSTIEVMPLARILFDQCYRPGREYRSVIVYLTGLEEETGTRQLDLFEDRLMIDKLEKASVATDEINSRFGKHAISLGSTMFLARGPKNDKDIPPLRRQHLLSGENRRQRLNIPMMMIAV